MNDLTIINKVTALAEKPITKEIIESDDFAEKYASLKEILDNLTAIKKTIEEKIGEVVVPLYAEDGTTTVGNSKYNFTYVAPTTSLTVDSAKLKKEFPDVYKQCVKTSQRKASLRITEKKVAEE